MSILFLEIHWRAPGATYNGTSEPLPGVKCDRWSVEYNIPGKIDEVLSLDVLQSDPNRPISYNISFTVPLYVWVVPIEKLKALLVTAYSR